MELLASYWMFAGFAGFKPTGYSKLKGPPMKQLGKRLGVKEGSFENNVSTYWCDLEM